MRKVPILVPLGAAFVALCMLEESLAILVVLRINRICYFHTVKHPLLPTLELVRVLKYWY